MSLPDQNALEKYRKITSILADSLMLSKLKGLFNRRYRLKELLDWLHKTMKWDKGDIPRHVDPLKIIEFGRGRCGEYSILFTALCLAHGYRARLVLDMSDHVWTEVWSAREKRWVHVDPSEKRIDDPLMYERDWKKDLKEVYAFENGTMENVTEHYRTAYIKKPK